MTTQTILDLVVILLLVPTIVYAIILNRRLVALRRSRDELARIVASFNDATMRAEAGIPKLKKATTEANQTLKDRVDKAQTLRDDLAFMVQRAEELANRLESSVKAARVDAGAAPAAPAAAAGFGPGVTAPVRGLAAEPPPRTLAAAATPPVFAETAAELRSALGAARAEARVPGAAVPRGRRGGAVAERAMNHDAAAIAEERSEAERELLKALQAAR
jgi:hypothetical protein